MLPPYGIILIIIVFAALLAPLIPMRRRSSGIAHFPVVTLVLLSLNVLLYCMSLSHGEPAMEVMRSWGLVPSEINLLTLVSHLFLHGSWHHLFGNMLGLWMFGPHVEEALGRIEYLLFYLGCGIAAALLHLVITVTLMPGAMDTPLVGASGAIFGLLGLFAVRYWRARVRVLLLFSVPAVWAVSLFALLQLVAGIVSLSGNGGRVANWAHVGGFVFGALLAIPLKMREDSYREYSKEDGEKAALIGDNEVAAAHYRQVLASDSDDADSHHALAGLYIRMRQGEAAHRHLQEAIRLYQARNQPLSVARVYQDALRAFDEFPLPPLLLHRIASSCEETEHYNLAIHALSELCRDHPAAREAEVGMLRLGRLHLQKMNQPQNAEGIFSEFLRLYPESEWAGSARRLRDEARKAARESAGRP